MLGHRKQEFFTEWIFNSEQQLPELFSWAVPSSLDLEQGPYNKNNLFHTNFLFQVHCRVFVGKGNPAPLLNESLRGTNVSEFSNSYFRQHNFLSLAPGFVLHQSYWMPGLLDKSSFRIYVGRTFLCSSVAVTARHCCLGWHQPSLSERWPLGFLDWLFLVCRFCIRQNSCYLCWQLWEALGGCSSCGKEQVLLSSTTAERFMHKHHNKNLKVAVMVKWLFSSISIEII